MIFRLGIGTLAALTVMAGFALMDFGAPLWVAGLVWLGAMGFVYYLLAGLPVLAIFLRAALALVPVAAVAGLMLMVILRSDILDDGESRALIAATAVAGGWIVAFVTGEMRHVNLDQERRRDIIRAALAEIDLIVAFDSAVDWQEAEHDVRAAFHADRRHQLFVLYGHQFGTLKRLMDQIEILASHQIKPVTEFFQLLDRLEQIEARMSEPAFASLPWERRESAALRYLKLQAQVALSGSVAAQALRARPFHGLLRRLT